MARAPLVEDPFRGWADVLTVRGDVHELRAFFGGKPFRAGRFDDPAALEAEARVLAAHRAEVYLTLNPLVAEFFSRHPLNETRSPERGGSVGDRHVLRRRPIFIDIEPERPSGTDTTHAQLAAARVLADGIAADLKTLGWELLALVCSGNGYHLRYRVDLPADDGRLVKRVLAALAHWYGDAVPGVKVDCGVFNASRLARVMGALNRKGNGGPETPHRMCELLLSDPAAAVVAEQQLGAVADESPSPADARGIGRARCASNGVQTPSRGVRVPGFEPWAGLDVACFVASRFPDANGPRPYGDGRIRVLPVRPWNPTHDNAASYVIEYPAGSGKKRGLVARCHHDGCVDRDWQDFWALFDERYAARLAVEKRRRGMPTPIANEWRRHGRRK